MTKETKTDVKQTKTGKFAHGNKIGKQFPKGVSGNPNGRPRLTRLTEALREQLAEINPDAGEQTIAEEIAKTLIKLALSGDVQAIKEIGNRTEGLPKQAVDLDLKTNDWKSQAEKYGLSESDIIAEARLLLTEFADAGSDETSN